MLEALNNKSMVGGIFYDLSKAFDCVNHTVLLSKLKFYGITGRAFKFYVFNSNDVDTIFNNFLNTYLRIFYHTFPLTLVIGIKECF